MEWSSASTSTIGLPVDERDLLLVDTDVFPVVF